METEIEKIIKKATQDMIDKALVRYQKQFSIACDEEVSLLVERGMVYVFGSELATLRLFKFHYLYDNAGCGFDGVQYYFNFDLSEIV